MQTFDMEFDIFVAAAFTDKEDQVKAQMLLNLAGRETIEMEQSFIYTEDESKENLETLKKKSRKYVTHKEM